MAQRLSERDPGGVTLSDGDTLGVLMFPDGVADHMGDHLDSELEPADRRALHELGWTDPPSVPPRPGAELSWEVATADGVEFIVASDPDSPEAWVAAVPRADR